MFLRVRENGNESYRLTLKKFKVAADEAAVLHRVHKQDNLTFYVNRERLSLPSRWRHVRVT